MGAFDRVLSGIPGLDDLLDYIRMGDNVVWQVTDLEEFRYFMEPFVEQAIRDKRNLICGLRTMNPFFPPERD